MKSIPSTCAVTVLACAISFSLHAVEPNRKGDENKAGSAQPSTRLSAGEYALRKSRIIEFFRQREASLNPVATTRTRSGQIIDWIKPESQVRGGRLATPPVENASFIPKSLGTNSGFPV
jgi:hypothetical protein